jgi:hypothetical protein
MAAAWLNTQKSLVHAIEGADGGKRLYAGDAMLARADARISRALQPNSRLKALPKLDGSSKPYPAARAAIVSRPSGSLSVSKIRSKRRFWMYLATPP